MAALATQVLAMVRKTLLLKRRNLRSTVFEVLWPIYFTAVLLLVKIGMPSISAPAMPEFLEASPTEWGTYACTFESSCWSGYPSTPDLHGSVIGYCPRNATAAETFANAVLTEVKRFPHPSLDGVLGFDTCDDMNIAQKKGFQPIMVLGLEVQTDLHNRAVAVDLRFDADQVPSIDAMSDNLQACRPEWSQDPSDLKKLQGDLPTGCPPLKYFKSLFLATQLAVTESASRVLGHDVKLITESTAFQQFPVPEYSQSAFGYPVFKNLFSFYFVLALGPTVQFLMLYVVTEKENKIKEALHMMGVSVLAFWASWFVTYLIVMVVVTLSLCALIFGAKLVVHSSFFLTWLIFYVYCASLIPFSFLLSSFFSKAKTASSLASLINAAFGAIFFIVSSSSMSGASVWAISLFSPVCFTLALERLADLENSGVGLTSSTWLDGGARDFSVGGAFLVFLIDIVVYFVLAMYLDIVLPSSYGAKRPWNFFLPSRPSTANLVPLATDTDDVEDGSDVLIRGLSKEYPPSKSGGSPTLAVVDMDLSIGRGEIFAFLGHNGAGKTTAIACLTGLTAPTRGDARIFGDSILHHMAEIRKRMGVCPQHDILYELLTVEEHIKFYSELKGVKMTNNDVSSLLAKVAMTDKANARAKSLSGGQKRKLSVAIAMVGDPDIVFLDEPTTGVDPVSRRALWSALKEFKQNRVIVLTTHFMDEADFLADRKLIMSNGVIKALGTSPALKNKFGSGYHLRLVGGDRHVTSADRDKILNLVRNHAKGATWEQQGTEQPGCDMSLLLPIETVRNFAPLLDEIDQRMSELNIASYGVSQTSLEEVFMNIADNDHEQEGDADANADAEASRRVLSETRWQRQSSVFAPIRAFIYVKSRVFFRNRMAFLFGLTIPLVLIIVAMVQNTGLSSSNSKPLVMGPELFDGRNVVPFGANAAVSQDEIGQVTAMLDGVGVELVCAQQRSHSPCHMTSDELNDQLMDAVLRKPSTFEVPVQGAIYINAVKPEVDFQLFFNGSMNHSPAALVGLLNTALIKADNASSIVQVGSRPFDSTQAAPWSNVIMILSIALGIVPTTYAMFIITERKLKIKQEITIVGLHPWKYWASCFLHDMMWFGIITVGAIVITVAYGTEPFADSAVGPFIICLLVFAVCVISLSYTLTFLFDEPESLSRILPSMLIFSGMIPFFAVTIFLFIDVEIAKTIHLIFSAFDPMYSVVGALMFMNYQAFTNVVNGDPAPTFAEYMEWDSLVLGPILFMLMLTIIYWAIILAIEWRKYHPRSIAEQKQSESSLNHEVDQDVAREERRVASSSDFLQVRNIRKEFKELVAVDDLSIGIPLGECFGLLGPNGAGKSTAMNMLTGDIWPTAGRVQVDGLDLHQHMFDAFKVTAYCPQTDPLYPEVTVQEHLRFYGVVRGMSEGDSAHFTEALIDALGIREHAEKQAQNLSGGTKRKLSLAIALIGDPKLIYLDEPSSGMDISSRQHMWKLLSDIRDDRAVVLTTHSMEEAAALCTRIGIVIRGGFKCLGSQQHLRARFARGYRLEITCDPRAGGVEAVTAFVEDNFDCELEESFGDTVRYQLREAEHGRSPVARWFRILEQRPECVQEYTLSQTTMEQVFINLCKKQEEESKTAVQDES